MSTKQELTSFRNWYFNGDMVDGQMITENGSHTVKSDFPAFPEMEKRFKKTFISLGERGKDRIHKELQSFIYTIKGKYTIQEIERVEALYTAHIGSEGFQNATLLTAQGSSYSLPNEATRKNTRLFYELTKDLDLGVFWQRNYSILDLIFQCKNLIAKGEHVE